MKIPYLPVRGRKVPSLIEGSIGARMEICRTSRQQILMVPCLHQSNGNIKRKKRAWRVQKCIMLIGADAILTSVGPHSTPFHVGLFKPQNGNMRISGLPILMVPRLYQSNGYMKRKLRAWRVQKCITLVCAGTTLTIAGLQSTPLNVG